MLRFVLRRAVLLLAMLLAVSVVAFSIPYLGGGDPVRDLITASVVGVILNLAVWFALHTWFRQTVHVGAGPLGFDAPLPASLDPWALALSVAAIVVIFRFKVGMIPTLLACALAGIVLHLTGAI